MCGDQGQSRGAALVFEETQARGLEVLFTADIGARCLRAVWRRDRLEGPWIVQHCGSFQTQRSSHSSGGQIVCVCVCVCALSYG